MAECELINNCPFFNDKMKNLPITVASFKRTYCKGDNSNCARFMVLKALGKEKVPIDLLPNQEKRAKQIIAAGG